MKKALGLLIAVMVAFSVYALKANYEEKVASTDLRGCYEINLSVYQKAKKDEMFKESIPNANFTAITTSRLNFIDLKNNFVQTIPEWSIVNLKESILEKERVIIEYNGILGKVMSSGLETNFIMVSIPQQEISMYLNGELVVNSPVVTGTANTSRATPRGIFSIQYKGLDVVLEGPGYASHVNYWMPIYGGVGIHDADGWRSEYGGDIYTYGGSHGCINVPLTTAAKIYENTYSGMLVIVE